MTTQEPIDKVIGVEYCGEVTVGSTPVVVNRTIASALGDVIVTVTDLQQTSEFDRGTKLVNPI